MQASPKPKARHRRKRIVRAIGAISAVVATVPAAHSEPLTGVSRNTYGMPGLIDMPTAEVREDGEFGVAISRIGSGTQRNTITFQIAPRLTGAFRYSRVPGLMPDDRAATGYVPLYDRSFDLHWQFLDEGKWTPAVAVGLRDFIGTGVYSGEYIVATKSLSDKLRATAGLGWGRLGSSGDIGSLGTRPAYDFSSNGGTANSDTWFRGTVAPFAGISWALNDKLTLKAEYSSDGYDREREFDDFDRRTPFNFGVDYKMNQLVSLQVYALHGETLGFQFSINTNPKNPPFPSGIERAPLPVRPRPAPDVDPDGWSGRWAADPEVLPAIQTVLAESLAKDGQILESMSLSATRAELRVRNETYGAGAQAIGHVARMATRALPSSVETIVVTPVSHGLALSSVTFKRSDLERMENTSAYALIEKITITPAADDPALRQTPDFYPKFEWALTPYADATFFDPDEPFRIDVGAELSGLYEIAPGLVLSGALRQKILGNQDQSTRASNSSVPHVRSDVVEYDSHGDLTIPRLQVAWYAQPMENVYSRVTTGLLERMYSGVSGELLWKPVDSRLALGVETNWVKQRDFDQRFAMRDYDTVTGHISAYYDFGKGYMGEIDYGRYLAKDWGATVSLDREFENGWLVGAFATVTNMSSEEFGEGSFDKGIRLTIPIAWATGKASMGKITSTIRPLTRDGGARLDVDGRLYDTVRPAHTGDLYDGWGRFWR